MCGVHVYVVYEVYVMYDVYQSGGEREREREIMYKIMRS